MDDFLKYEGCNMLRGKLVLSTLSGKSVKIVNIRHKDDDPGLREFEGSFIRLLDEITNGSIIEINETGTSLFYQPGLLHGGKIEMNCNVQRSLGYYLEPLIQLAPFCKIPVEARLRGVTNDEQDQSVDMIKLSTIPVLKQFLGTDEGLELKIISRGMKPNGGGEIFFKCPVRRQLRPVQLKDDGKIKRIRGVSYTIGISPVTANRLVESAKGILLKFLPDIYIYTDHTGGNKQNRSPGFGMCLIAESTNGCFHSVDCTSVPRNENGQVSVAEDVGKECAHALLEEILRGGCVDSINQSTVALLMALGPKDVNKVLTGPLSTHCIEFLRLLRDFCHLTFKLEAIRDDELRTGTKKVLMTCVGIGYTNVNKPTN